MASLTCFLALALNGPPSSGSVSLYSTATARCRRYLAAGRGTSTSPGTAAGASAATATSTAMATSWGRSRLTGDDNSALGRLWGQEIRPVVILNGLGRRYNVVLSGYHGRPCKL
ncbi:hypothetical protein B0T24DRAFT_660908 [Lasiosphaeria ovina]|uniref:Uncharacterized protein n=1 Tax=Lasiosphaeria ovina TaxID=92902 RepID=A0AAE0NIH7_9PEZI|nr:hypothetical protein B0T24DRAFT_660908 [Lasiosphaeria ovina]